MLEDSATNADQPNTHIKTARRRDISLQIASIAARRGTLLGNAKRMKRGSTSKEAHASGAAQ